VFVSSTASTSFSFSTMCCMRSLWRSFSCAWNISFSEGGSVAGTWTFGSVGVLPASAYVHRFIR